MKNLLLLAVLATVATSYAEKNTGKKASGSEQEIIRIEQEMLDALLKGDATANERYMAQDYVFTGPDGKVMDKTQSVADVKSGDLKLESSKMDDMKVHVYGDTAVATYGSTDKGSYKGKDISGKFRWTDVFVKRGGKWQLVAGHGTPIAQT